MNNLSKLITKHKTLILLIIVAFIYILSSLYKNDFDENENFYLEQARAFLQGRLDIVNPIVKLDLSFFNGRWFSSFPPFPSFFLAIMYLLPVKVAFLFPFFITLFGIANIFFLYVLLKKVSKDEQVSLILTLAFSLGTVHWWSSVQNGAWFFAHTLSVFLGLLALIYLYKSKFFLSGIAIGLAFLTRQLFVFYSIFICFVIYQSTKNLKKVLIHLIPVVVALLISIYLNYLRFGSIWESGYRYMQVKDLDLINNIQNWGIFNLQYIPWNFYTVFFRPFSFISKFPFLSYDGWGESIFLTSPFLIYALFPKKKSIQLVLLINIILILSILLCYYNNGWMQFGYRFALDFLPLTFLLLANKFNSIQKIPKLFYLLVLFSLIINTIGIIY